MFYGPKPKEKPALPVPTITQFSVLDADNLRDQFGRHADKVLAAYKYVLDVSDELPEGFSAKHNKQSQLVVSARDLGGQNIEMVQSVMVRDTVIIGIEKAQNVQSKMELEV